MPLRTKLTEKLASAIRFFLPRWELRPEVKRTFRPRRERVDLMRMTPVIEIRGRSPVPCYQEVDRPAASPFAAGRLLLHPGASSAVPHPGVYLSDLAGSLISDGLGKELCERIRHSCQASRWSWRRRGEVMAPAARITIELR
jgi:hypothetical protein